MIRKCPKCGEKSMIKTVDPNENVSFQTINRKFECCEIIQYMCTKCGYIERYATNPKLYNGGTEIYIDE